MNLLEATSTLIDCARTYAPESDRVIARAVKRMEKRLRLLQLRSAKSLRRRRRSAWVDCLAVINATCRHCGFMFDFGTFIKQAQICGRGHINRLDCARCGRRIQGIR